VLFVRINHLIKPFLLQDCASLFPTLAEYFMYSHLSYFLYIALTQEMRSPLMKTSSRHAKPPVICLWQDGVLSAA
jgi:hypothetical protein